jgi:hypothetical protein
MLRAFPALAAAALWLCLPTPVQAFPVTYTVELDGAQEAPGPGDPDGSGVAVLNIETSTNSISWNITVQNIELPLTGAHIHVGAPGVPGGVVVDLSASLVGGPIMDPDVANVVANPTGYYVNLHNSAFPGGAIRGQIPEPATLGLFGLGLAAVALLRRAA